MQNNFAGYVLAAWLLAIVPQIHAAELVKAKQYPTVTPGLQEILAQKTSDTTTSVWIYFTDKGFSQNTEFERRLQRVGERLNPRTVTRREKVKSASDLVDFKDIPVPEMYISEILEVSGVAKHRTTSRWFNAVSIEANEEAIATIADFPFVRRIDIVASGRRIEPIDDSPVLKNTASRDVVETTTRDYGNSYAQLNQINVIAAHDSGYSGAGVLVLMLDTGYYTDHEAIAPDRIIAQYDFINQDSVVQNQTGDPVGQHDHGTATSTTLGAAVDGVLYGPAYECDYLLAKTEILDQEIQVEEDYYVAGLEWGERLGADLASSSLGYIDWYRRGQLDGNTAVTTRGVDIAVSEGMVVVTAAGNYGRSGIIAPADANQVISCGAVHYDSTIASFSSRGPTADGRIKPEVDARGVSVACAGTSSPTSVTLKSGTSLSTPLVAGVAALVIQAHPDWTPKMVREALMMTASQSAHPDNTYGWGIIDAVAAINYSPAWLTGDVNQDGIIAVNDIIALLTNVLPTGSIVSPEQQAAADFNYDGVITTDDVRALTIYLLGE